MATIRDQIVSAAETRFAAILVTGGYRTDIGASVRSWQATPPRWEDLPVLVVSDPEEQLSQPAYGRQRHTMTVRAEAILPGGTIISTLRAIGADILQAIGVDGTWGGLAEVTRGARVTIDPGTVESVSAGVVAEIEIMYETAVWAS